MYSLVFEQVLHTCQSHMALLVKLLHFMSGGIRCTQGVALWSCPGPQRLAGWRRTPKHRHARTFEKFWYQIFRKLFWNPEPTEACKFGYVLHIGRARTATYVDLR